MISQFEKWVFLGMGFIVVTMLVAGGLAMKTSRDCRLELAKAGRSAEDIIKICP